MSGTEKDLAELTMKTNKLIPIVICAGLLFGCGDDTISPEIMDSSSGINGASPGAPNTKASPGGFWHGEDSDGGSIIMVVTETGRFHLVDADLSQGSGVLSVSDANEVESNFHFVTQRGSTFADGTTSTFCALSGVVAERQAMTISVDCSNLAGLRNEFEATLSNKELYERDSSLAAIAGNYQGDKIVLDIAGDGSIFSQDPGTGCVVNGQVNIIDNAFNAYDVEFTYSNCVEQAAALNGSNFVGIALLDDTVVPEALFVAAIGNTDGDVPSFEGNFVSYVQTLERL